MFADLEPDEEGVSHVAYHLGLSFAAMSYSLLRLFQAVPNVPQRIASRHTARSKQPLPSSGGGKYKSKY